MGFNQNRFCILCLISISILVSVDKGRASALETWVEQSDIICTATVVTVDRSYTERVMMNGYPYLATSVTLRVRVPIKGSVADQQILVKTQRADLSNILTGAGYYPFFNGLKVGEYYLLFAKKNIEGGSYSLTNPYANGPQIVLGRTMAYITLYSVLKRGSHGSRLSTNVGQ